MVAFSDVIFCAASYILKVILIIHFSFNFKISSDCVLLCVEERAQSSQKKGSGVDAAADDRSSNNSSKYTSPLPLIRLREGAAATSEEALVIRRPTSTISTSSAEYHTPGYYSSGDESARFLAGGDDSEFSEIDDFAFGPNMAAALLSNNSNSYLKNNSNQPPGSQQNAHQPTLTRVSNKINPTEVSFNFNVLYQSLFSPNSIDIYNTYFFKIKICVLTYFF